MNNKKIILIIISITLVFLLTYTILKTFSLFESSATGTAETDLATWVIKVNNTDITSLSSQNNTFNLGSINWSNQNHVVEGKGAPGSTGTINITIDPDDTEVSFTYDITFDFTNINNEEFQVYSVTEGNNNLTRTGEYTYTGIAPLSEIQNNKIYNVVVTFIWNNSEYNDEDDYNLASRAGENINIPITIRVKQYGTGDTITEYVEPLEEEEEENNGE